jgi:hypothetical protein
MYSITKNIENNIQKVLLNTFNEISWTEYCEIIGDLYFMRGR